ncbi:MAG: response regulator [Oscillospiraceae bacterium]|nr:response regulator [Oscillospiraceae bacterium]
MDSGKPIKIFIADCSRDFRTLLTDYIGMEQDMTVVGSSGSCVESAELVGKLLPDVLVTDLLLQSGSGLALINKVRALPRAPHIIVVTAYCADSAMSELGKLNIGGCLVKPCVFADVAAIARQCVRSARPSWSDRELDAEISAALAAFGIVPHLRGFRFLREAIKRVILDPEQSRGVTKSLYPDLAKQLGTTPQNIERAIRCAITSGVKNGDPLRRDEYFRRVADVLPRSLTNAKFIALCAHLSAERLAAARRRDVV